MRVFTQVSTLLSLAATLALCGCSGSANRIGEVFLVNPDGSTANFGGSVDVFVVGQAAMSAEAIAELNDKVKALVVADRELAKATATMAETQEQLDNSQGRTPGQAIRGGSLADQIRQQATQQLEAIERRQQLRKQAVPAMVATAFAESARNSAAKDFAEVWSDIVESAALQTKTDSKGTFEVLLKSGQGLCVYAMRKRGYQTEHCVWVLDASKIPRKGKVLLSNDNLLPACGE